MNAQQARRVIDRLVGYKLSPPVSSKIRRGLSAGRVQSVAVRLVVDREREIEAFVAGGVLDADSRSCAGHGSERELAAELTRIDGETSPHQLEEEARQHRGGAARRRPHRQQGHAQSAEEERALAAVHDRTLAAGSVAQARASAPGAP